MPCELCEKRLLEEKKSLSECKGKCEELNKKAHSLSLVVAVLSTLVGKETLDMALGLSSTIDQIAVADPKPTEATPPTITAYYPDQPHKYRDVRRSAPFATPEIDLLFADLPPLLIDLGYQHEEIMYEPMYLSDNYEYVLPEAGIFPLMGLAAIPRRRRQ